MLGREPTPNPGRGFATSLGDCSAPCLGGESPMTHWTYAHPSLAPRLSSRCVPSRGLLSSINRRHRPFCFKSYWPSIASSLQTVVMLRTLLSSCVPLKRIRPCSEGGLSLVSVLFGMYMHAIMVPGAIHAHHITMHITVMLHTEQNGATRLMCIVEWSHVAVPRRVFGGARRWQASILELGLG